ncbi:MAG: hypothetical protein GY737_14065 [Desulfobacteraceae bacterium]|nr:hypothetical protein [Desulfobacteraceae bacterium]
MYRTINIIVLCFLAASIAGCSGLAGDNGQGRMGSLCSFTTNAPDGWKSLETLPQRYKDLPGVEAGEKILKILSSPDGSGIILLVSEKIPVPMYEFQKDVYGLMDQRGKGYKKNKSVKKYRCMNSYKNNEDLFGIDSYYEYWKFQDARGKVKGVRRTYFVSRDDASICSKSKILYSSFKGYDANLIAFSDITISETN